uniref:Ras homolog family member U n=1 Tax=Sinocyclocheilus grahami TaxID=75366 RepID=A0A672NPF9_SINGR
EKSSPFPPPVPPRAAPQRHSPASAAVPERRAKCVLAGAYKCFTISARVVVDGRPLSHFSFCFQDEFERLRPLCYRDAGVFLLCYSVVLPSSFRSVTSRWAPEVHHLCPGVPIILVGTRSDLGDDARLCARSISAVTFAECSALTQKNLKEVFDGAILAGTRHTEAAAWPRMHALREKTPDKIRQLSET